MPAGFSWISEVASTGQISPLLPPAGTCAVIVTTRRHDLFATAGTYRFEVGPFSHKEQEALHLFAKFLGGKRVDQEKSTLCEIADLLGHLPLALAITASRLAYEPGWTAQTLWQRLRHHQGRLNTLTYESRSVWLSANLSYTALAAKQQRFFAILGAFASETVNTEAVAYVAGLSLAETQDHLRQLYNLSLVQTGHQGSYRLHPLVHDYAREQLESLAERTEVLARMVSFFVRHLETHRKDYPALEKDVDNILWVLEVAYAEKMWEILIQGTIAFFHFGEPRGLYTLLERHLERARQAAVTLGDDANLASVLFYLGYIPRRRGHYRQAEPSIQESLVLARQVEDRQLIAMALAELGIIAIHSKEEVVQGEARLQESLILARELEDKELILGTVALARGDHTRAKDFYGEICALVYQTKDSYEMSTVLYRWGEICLAQNVPDLALPAFKAYLEIVEEEDSPEKIALATYGLARVSAARGRMTAARQQGRTSQTILEALNHDRSAEVKCWLADLA